MKTSAQGNLAEDKACEYLQKQGLILLEKNYRCRNGEIDLIMRDNEQLVFIEVRYRSNTNFGTALDTVDQNKMKKIITTAKHYLNQHKLDVPTRFDVVGFDASLKANWISDAFSAF